jgi:hypothetical protein
MAELGIDKEDDNSIIYKEEPPTATNSVINSLGGAYNIKQITALAEQMLPKDKPFDPALASLLYFTKMGELASKPGATLFGSVAGAGVAPAQYLLQKEKEKAERESDIAKTTLTLAATLGKTKASKAYTDPSGNVKHFTATEFGNLSDVEKGKLVPYAKPVIPKVKTASRGGLATYYGDKKEAGEFLTAMGIDKSNSNFNRLVEKLVTKDPEKVGQPFIGAGGLAMELLPTYLGNKITNIVFSPVPNTQSLEYKGKLRRLEELNKDKTAFLNKGFNVIPSINTALNVLLSGVQTGKVEQSTMGIRNVLAGTFGLSRKDLEGQQILESISNKLAPGMRPVGSGSTSDMEFNAFKSAVLTMENTPFANYLSLWTLKKVTENSAKATKLEEELLTNSKNYSQKYINNQIDKVDTGLYSKFKTKDENGDPIYSSEDDQNAAAKSFFKNLPRGSVFINQDEDGQPVFTRSGKNDLFLIKGFPRI